MDPDSPAARVERTFWTVWYYITGAVNRFFRPEPTDITDPNSIQEPAVDSEPVNSGHAEGDNSRSVVDEEQPLATAQLLSSSNPLVAWELCTTDIDLGPAEESAHDEIQPGRGSESEASEEGKGTREEQVAQAGHDDEALLDTKEDKQEENRERKLSTGGPDGTQETREYEEHANMESLRLTEDAMSEDVEESGRKADVEEETKGALTPEDPQKMGEIVTNVQVKGEDDEMQHEDEDFEAEDTEGKLCLITDLSLEEEVDKLIEEAEIEVDSDGVQQLASKNEPDEEPKRVENQPSVCEELSDDSRDVKEDPDFTSLHVELQMTDDKSGIVSEDELIVAQEHVMAHRSESDEVEDVKGEGRESTLDEGAVIGEETVKEALDIQTIDEALEEEEVIKTVTEDTSGPLIEEEEGGLVLDSMKTAIRDSEKEFESDFNLKDETDELANKPQDGAEELLVEFETDEGLCDARLVDAAGEEVVGFADKTFLEAEVQKMTETSLFPEPIDVMNSEQNSDMTFSLLEEFVEAGLLKQSDEAEPKLLEVDMQDAGIDMEETENEAPNNQTIDEVSEEENDIQTVTEDSQEEDVLTEHMTCSKEMVQNAKTELHTAAGEQEGVAEDTEEQTKTREADNDGTESHITVLHEESDVTHISVDERFSHEGQVEEERLSSEADNKESCMETACTSVTIKPEGETGQEMSGEFKNIPPGVCEGRVVVLQELNFPTCEETQEGVPEYNNESDENTTQWFLEDGDYEEIQGSLPEEVENKEPESLQNCGSSTEADYLLVREHMEEEQESTQDIKNGFDAGLTQETKKVLVEAVIQGSGPLIEEEEGGLLLDSMKTSIEDSEKEFESNFGLNDETVEVANEPQDGTEELLVRFETDEGLCDARLVDAAGEEVVGFADKTFLEAEVQKMTETSLFPEPIDVMNWEQISNMTFSSLEEFVEAGLLKQSDEAEPKLLDVEIQDAGIDMEETGYGVEEETAEEEILHLRVVGMAESELSGVVESLETENQLSHEALEISKDELASEAEGESKTDESKPKDLTLPAEEMVKHAAESEWSYEETICSIGGRQDVIDEELLDFWIETSLSEDTDAIKHQEGSEPGQQTEPSSEEQDEVSAVHTEKDKDQLVESTSREILSDTEMSSSTVESGFLDQSLSEWGTQNSETQLLKSTSSGSFQGINNTLANMSISADLSEMSTQQSHSESQDVFMEEAAEAEQSDLKEEESITETRFHPDSEVTSPESRLLNQDLDLLQEKTGEERAESAETESGSKRRIDDQVTDWKDAEEAEAKALTEKSAPFNVGETKAEEEPFEITVSDSPDEIKRVDSGRSRSSSEASIEEEVLKESSSQDDTKTKSERRLSSPDEPRPGSSDDIDESLTGLNRTEVTKSEDEMQVDSFVLDFTVQRSRIAVKNPRVRPPKDPRSLLHMPSLDPTPSPHLAAKVPAGVPLGGLGIGIRLPGLGAGFPVLKKTKPQVADENSPDTLSKETVPEEKSDAPKQDEAQHKPKWMPPRHPGFGNPLMSELKNKLKKPTKD
ncbi:microtubule-associated protein 1B [Centropristis striata]|uniref:microtubule-associated protein 1B n=1 Tax=Centropristis striata TaxID=184440 RepID=UPI0027DF3899|nr:microtubule-associated protein 1B [Centropristis striata]